MEKIDAVITWVDGSDPKYQVKYQGFLEKRGDFKKQYMQADEIDFCVLSIIKYAPFIRKIFIVTDGQAPDLTETICSIAAWNGNSKTFAELKKLYTNAKTMEEKLRFLGAMCGFQDKKLLIKTLDFSQTAAVRSQNMQLPIMKIAGNPYGDKVLWSWLKKNWKKINKKVGHGNPLFNRIVASITGVADDSMEKEIKLFFKNNPTPGTERTQSQTLERIRINSKFLRTMRKEFKNG